MAEKINNLILCSHAGSNKKYLFRLPLGAEIERGQKVFVDTVRGEVIATAETDNFYFDKATTEFIIEGSGAYEPLRMVMGLAVQDNSYKKVALTSELPF